MPLPVFPEGPPAPVRSTGADPEYAMTAEEFALWWETLPAQLTAYAVELAGVVANYYNATSASSVAIGTDAKSFTIETGKAFVVGQFVLVADAAAPTVNWMYGQVTSHDTETGALTVAVSLTKGSGTKTSWIIGLTGANRPLNDGDYGDITVSSDGAIYTIRANTVTNAKLADMATARLKGRTTAGTGDPEDLTGTQATALLDVFSSTTKGLVPAGSGGNSAVFLAGDGLFRSPSADASAWTQIQTAALTGTSVAFTSIPTSFSDLELELSGLDFNGTGTFTIELTADNVAWTAPVTIYNESVSGSNIYEGAVHLAHYLRDRGPSSLGLINASATGGFAASVGAVLPIWRCPGGIKGIRLAFTGTGFSAGTATLFGR